MTSKIEAESIPLRIRSNPLGVRVQDQVLRNWCWATCASEMLVFRGEPVDKCEVASFGIGRQCCPAPTTPPNADPCDMTIGPERVSEIWDHYRVSYSWLASAAGYEAVKASIQAGNPVEVGLDWSDAESGHLILLDGFNDNGQKLRYLDSAAVAVGWATYDEILSGFGHGAWICTWTNLR